MDSINPWLDVDELNRLTKALMEPAKEEAPQKEFSDDVVRSVASTALAKASDIAKRAGVIATPRVRQAILPELGEWLYTNAKCFGLCVVDRDGDVLHAAMPNTEWTQLTVSIATKGQVEESDNAMSVRIKVSSNRYLQFIRVVTARGPLLVGLLTKNLLKDSQLAKFTSLVERISAPDQVEQRS